MIDPVSVSFATYEVIKFWLPLVSGFLLVIKAYTNAKKKIGAYANTLFSNHLEHIQAATMETVTETKKTNELLQGNVAQTDYIAKKLEDHSEKETQVWNGVVQTLAILEDRTKRRSSRARG